MRSSEFVKEFGNRVRARRQDLGFSQEALASRAGLHRTAVSHIEKAGRSSTLETIEKLARALQVEPAALMPSLGIGRRKQTARRAD